MIPHLYFGHGGECPASPEGHSPVSYPGACGCLLVPPLLTVTGTPITYLKLVTGGVRHHLCVAGQASTESMTLCGCVVTRLQSWKEVKSLEGDECPHCADLAFGGGAPKTQSRSTGGDVG